MTTQSKLIPTEIRGIKVSGEIGKCQGKPVKYWVTAERN